MSGPALAPTLHRNADRIADDRVPNLKLIASEPWLDTALI
jgi:hypothetical protein